jgi:hypothetical protein
MDASGHEIPEATYDIALYKGDQHSSDETHIELIRKPRNKVSHSMIRGHIPLELKTLTTVVKTTVL